MNLPTDTLIDMLYIILAGEVAISASDAAEIEQIQRELQRRGDEECWSFQTVNRQKACDEFLDEYWPQQRRAFDDAQNLGVAQREMRNLKNGIANRN
ncbi:MAG: hypothetical protein WBV69_10810 [Candidatus Sulfotelmatobacter sp.]